MSRLHGALATALAPALGLWLARRARQGKEDPARLGERRGLASRPRPPGPLLWLHGASVGETRAALPLLHALLDAHPRAQALVTSGTLASARLLDTALPPRALHQFAPLDVPGWIARFLDHWRPDAALWVESELWPNLLDALGRRGIPAALVNARLSPRAFARWRRLHPALRPDLAAFATVLAQSADDAARLAALGARGVQDAGNLKFDAPLLPAGPEALAALAAALGDRPRWLAASTHPGEDALVATAHEIAARQLPRLLTILVPRHPARGAAIAAELRARGLAVARRGAGETLDAATAIYLADTMGELGLFYRLAPLAFMGKSLASGGGQNPLEGIALGSAILSGPDVSAFAAIYADLAAADGVRFVDDAAALGAAVAALLADAAARARLAAAGATVAARGRGALARHLAALGPLRAALGPVADDPDHARA